jgi:Sec23/Sec24 trunk domain
LQRACCIPLIAVVQPLLPSAPTLGQPSSSPSQDFLTEDIARCAGCAAYINHLCSFEKYGWACSLCGLQNDYSSVANRRYLGGSEARSSLPELAPGVVQALSPVHDDTEDDSISTPQELLTTPAIPIVLALVDVAACSEHLELVRSSLMAAVEGLSADSKFGLIAFGGDGLALFEPGVSGPCVRHVPLLAAHGTTSGSGNGPTGAELAQVLPLNNLLTQVQGSGKRAIIAAIEALEPMGAGKRPAGEALQAVLRLLGSSVSEDRSLTGALGARLIMILAGPPNCGRGSVINSPFSNNNINGGGVGGFLRSRSNSDFNAGAPFLLDPYYPEITAWASQPDVMAQNGASTNQNNTSYKNGGGGININIDSGINGWTEAAEAIAVKNLAPAAAELVLVDKDDLAEVSINWESAIKFYTEAGAAAAALGVIVDLYAVSDSFVGLEALRGVAVGSGGSLALYPPPTVEECALTQDLYKRMAEPYAFGCLLRMRTCPELRVINKIGGKSNTTDDINNKNSDRLRPDPRYSDLFHIACCHPYDAFQLQLEHATRSGFASKSTPVVQLVFQYMCIVPNSGGGSVNNLLGTNSRGGTPTKSRAGGSGSGMVNYSNTSSVLQRRTRIVTTAFPVAHSAKEVYASVNPQAHTFTLLQYLCNVVATDGLDAARTALLERTVELAAAYHEWITIGEILNDPGARRREGSMVPVDPAFKACEALQGLPRAAYALLRGPLLGGTATHPDTLCALRTLWDILPPAELATAVYPHLSSWASPDQLAFPRHSLCRAALALSRQPIYLLDAYRCLVVFYASQGHQHSGADNTNSSAPFPPPHHSRLRQHWAALSQARRLTPRVTVVREGEPGADQIFGQWLIEDDRGGGAAHGATFLDFLAQIKELVTQVINQH